MMARITPTALASLQVTLATRSDDDLPPSERRDRGEVLRIRGVAQAPGAELLYDGREVTLVGPGRGQAWWIVAWLDDDIGIVFHTTAHRSRLEAP